MKLDAILIFAFLLRNNIYALCHGPLTMARGRRAIACPYNSFPGLLPNAAFIFCSCGIMYSAAR